jgi:hypothetical protein
VFQERLGSEDCDPSKASSINENPLIVAQNNPEWVFRKTPKDRAVFSAAVALTLTSMTLTMYGFYQMSTGKGRKAN